nr:hypothetical protein [Candidatus Njordarchaeota archaeon]
MKKDVIDVAAVVVCSLPNCRFASVVVGAFTNLPADEERTPLTHVHACTYVCGVPLNLPAEAVATTMYARSGHLSPHCRLGASSLSNTPLLNTTLHP